jgi:hypothetical protein
MVSHHLNYLLQRGIVLLFLLVTFFSLAGVVLAIYFVPNPSLLFGRPEIGAPSDEVVVATLEDTEFTLPETIVPKIDKPILGNATRIDLRLPWPFDRQQLNIVRPANGFAQLGTHHTGAPPWPHRTGGAHEPDLQRLS